MRVFAIAVEGAVTEPAYFKALAPLVDGRKVLIEVLPPRSGESSPAHVLERLDDFVVKNALTEFDERWLVIDVDRHAHLESTVREATTKRTGARKFAAAVSNPCFEIWLLLHLVKSFEPDADGAAFFTETPLTSASVKRRLDRARTEAHLGDLGSFCSLERVRSAIERGRALDTAPHELIPPVLATQVYRLVARLLEVVGRT